MKKRRIIKVGNKNLLKVLISAPFYLSTALFKIKHLFDNSWRENFKLSSIFFGLEEYIFGSSQIPLRG